MRKQGNFSPTEVRARRMRTEEKLSITHPEAERAQSWKSLGQSRQIRPQRERRRRRRFPRGLVRVASANLREVSAIAGNNKYSYMHAWTHRRRKAK